MGNTKFIRIISMICVICRSLRIIFYFNKVKSDVYRVHFLPKVSEYK